MQKILPCLATVAILGGCAYALDTQNQEITILTPGAEDAVCYAYVEDLKYRIHPPEKTIIFRSREDMRIDCLAPGNRRQEMTVSSEITKSGYYNAATVGVGALWDHASGALYTYPDVIEVSFVGVPTKPFAMPAHNNPDIKQPEEYKLEEFLPSNPRLNSDSDKVKNEIRRRNSGGFSQDTYSGSDAFSEQETYSVPSGKGALRDVPSTAAPTRLFPGQ